jgi:hypothetical protein
MLQIAKLNFNQPVRGLVEAPKDQKAIKSHSRPIILPCVCVVVCVYPFHPCNLFGFSAEGLCEPKNANIRLFKLAKTIAPNISLAIFFKKYQPCGFDKYCLLLQECFFKLVSSSRVLSWALPAVLPNGESEKTFLFHPTAFLSPRCLNNFPLAQRSHTDIGLFRLIKAKQYRQRPSL